MASEQNGSSSPARGDAERGSRRRRRRRGSRGRGRRRQDSPPEAIEAPAAVESPAPAEAKANAQAAAEPIEPDGPAAAPEPVEPARSAATPEPAETIEAIPPVEIAPEPEISSPTADVVRVMHEAENIVEDAAVDERPELYAHRLPALGAELVHWRPRAEREFRYLLRESFD